MPRKPPDLSDVFHVEQFKQTAISRPLVRLYRVPVNAMVQVSLRGEGLKSGERLVLAFAAKDLADRTEAELIRAVHAVIKNLRRAVANDRPSAEALKVYRLKTEDGLTYRTIAERFASKWRSDPESRERRAKRCVAKVKAWNAEAEAHFSERQRAILRIAREFPVVEPDQQP